ncbi:hypothetical protein LCGC14_1797460 [marine sediment metagenome]|uniref:Uncharacterized protein n=1 Tax=marine sediment metagenome TaxID=412755 RepID=A0A0F9GQM7_9ZZZZ
MSAPPSFDRRAKARIDRCIASVNDVWFPGAPYDPAAFARFNDDLLAAMKTQSLTRITAACDKFEALMARQVTSAKLDPGPKGRYEPKQVVFSE